MTYNDPLNYQTDNGHVVCKDCYECITCGTCKCNKSTFQFEHLEHAIKNMTKDSKLYKTIKEEIKKRGHWKNLPRGWKVAGKESPLNKGK